MLIKAEWLINRVCNLHCTYCAIVRGSPERPRRPEMTQTQMRDGIQALLQLGCQFIAIYGGEPFLSPLLLPMLKHCKKVGMKNTVITNGSCWNADWTARYIGMGLESVTVSMDALDPLPGDTKDDEKRRQDAMRVMKDLSQYVEPGLYLDREVSVTITPRNLDVVVALTRFWTEQGVWVSYDFVHVGSHPGTKRARRYSPWWTGSDDERRKVEAVAKEIKAIGAATGRVHTAEFVIDKWPQQYNRMDWHCSRPAWVSVDCDGSMLPCDDLEDPDVAKIKVWDLKKRWTEFEELWTAAVPKCPGCFWSTHVMSERMVGTQEGTERFLHGRG